MENSFNIKRGQLKREEMVAYVLTCRGKLAVCSGWMSRAAVSLCAVLRSTLVVAVKGNYASCLHSLARCSQPPSLGIHSDDWTTAKELILFTFCVWVCVCVYSHSFIPVIPSCTESRWMSRWQRGWKEYLMWSLVLAEGLRARPPVCADTGCNASCQIEFGTRLLLCLTV